MIGRLTGQVLDSQLDGSVILDVGGVGYEVHMPLGAPGRLPADGPAVVHVHTHVREDAITLFGFDDPDDKAAFRILTGVSGVGPKVALAVLGKLGAGDLGEAVARGDRAALKGIPGVGKKTVERLLMELKDKPLGSGSPKTAKASRPAPAAAGGAAEMVVSALTNMGYKAADAEKAIASLDDIEGVDPQELLRRALSAMN